MRSIARGITGSTAPHSAGERSSPKLQRVPCGVVCPAISEKAAAAQTYTLASSSRQRVTKSRRTERHV